MEIQRAVNLGQLHQKLGIKADSRIVLWMGQNVTQIWDLDGEMKYTIHSNGAHATAESEPLTVGKALLTIIRASDEELEEMYRKSASHGSSDERTTIFTELCYRNINVLRI